MQNYFYMSQTQDGWANLARDEWFLEHIQPGEFLLYLYVNRNAVIIGQNQNAWKECNLKAMEADQVQLVRRISGGGAVFHDAGNLNFSFIAHKDSYDLQRQMGVILSAVRSLGIPAEFSGRNDLLANGSKFSGNAFCARGENMQHHGTLLISADLARLSRYLNVDPKKIRSKGVSSVRARVCNLSELAGNISVERMVDTLKQAYAAEYGSFAAFPEKRLDRAAIDALTKKHASWQWQLGRAPSFDYEIDRRFSWGGIQLLLTLRDGCVAHAQAFSDALDTSLCGMACARLAGVRFIPAEIAAALRGDGDQPQLCELAGDISSMEF